MSKTQNVDVENSELKIETYDHKQIFKLNESWIKCSKVKTKIMRQNSMDGFRFVMIFAGLD